MFHMLSSFNLEPNTSAHEFREAVDEFTKYLQKLDLIHSTGPIGRRQKHPVMDTDDQRDHGFYFIMSFRDRAQCDRAVEQIYRHEEPGESIHNAVFSLIQDPVFTCWEDI